VISLPKYLLLAIAEYAAQRKALGNEMPCATFVLRLCFRLLEAKTAPRSHPSSDRPISACRPIAEDDADSPEQLVLLALTGNDFLSVVAASSPYSE